MASKSWGGQNRLDRFDNEIEQIGSLLQNTLVGRDIHKALYTWLS